MKKFTIIYLGNKTEVTGSYQLMDGKPDFCCHVVKFDNKVVTHKLYTPEFTAIEKLVLIEIENEINN